MRHVKERQDSTHGGLGSERRTTKTVAVVALTAALLAAVATDALSASPDRGTASAFTDGTVDLAVSPASAAISLSGMAPGDRAITPLTVSNEGTLRFRYAVTSIETDDASASFARQLELTIEAGVATCTVGGYAAGGTVLYGPGRLASVKAIDVIGDPAPGAQPGDRVLDPGDSEVLCLRVVLPSGTGNAFQRASASVTFRLDAEPV